MNDLRRRRRRVATGREQIPQIARQFGNVVAIALKTDARPVERRQGQRRFRQIDPLVRQSPGFPQQVFGTPGHDEPATLTWLTTFLT